MKNFPSIIRTATCTTLLVISVSALGQPSNNNVPYKEKYRPQFHFSPNSNWIGDPDGLVKYKGIYHLFWWGHAYSEDMVHWTELPYPIQGDPDPYEVTTGSAVIDKFNVSGFGAGSMVAFPTLAKDNDQRVGIAHGTSLTDKPYNVNKPKFTDLTLYNQNPILSPIANFGHFRDPQVFWDAARNRWAMAVTRGEDEEIEFYKSDDLKSWVYTGKFGLAGVGTNWETPDLFELPVDNVTGNKKWVLVFAPFSDKKVKYFIGDFNGTTFTNMYPGQAFTLDHGKDFYAARTWRDYDQPQSRTTILGWMGNWDYSTIAPSKYTYGGLGAQSVPRDLALKTYPEGIRLTQNPIPELTVLRQTPGTSFQNKTISGTNAITTYGAFSPSQNVYEIDATFSFSANSVFGFNLCVKNDVNKRTIVKYDRPTQTLSVDRNNASDASINGAFPATSTVTIPSATNQLRLRILVDKSSVEVFANDGQHVLTTLTYPGDDQLGIEVFSQVGSVTLQDFKGWQLNSIWNSTSGHKVLSGGIYEIVNRNSGKVLDAPGSANNTQLQQYEGLNGSNQRWKADILEAGYFSGGDWIPTYYRFTNQGNGKVIDLRDGSTANGGVVQQYGPVSSDNQKWSLEGVGGGFWKIVSKGTSRHRQHKVVEVESALTNNQAPLQTWTFLGYHHQEWKFNLVTPPAAPRMGMISPADESTNDSGHPAFMVYPNPSTQSSTLVRSPIIVGATDSRRPAPESLIYGLTVRTITGALVKTIKNLGGLNAYTLATDDLNDGAYLITVYNGKTYETHRIVVSH